jgi:hypothetical protein
MCPGYVWKKGSVCPNILPSNGKIKKIIYPDTGGPHYMQEIGTQK